MTPIEKNVIVVDEQGNEYEATYPRRAKGLVKNGRARFVDENKICLACPPNENLEDIKMEDTKKLTTREIFDQITLLQKQLTENSQTSLHRLGDAIYSLKDENGEVSQAISNETIESICAVFSQREAMLISLLDFYKKMYDDCLNEQKRKVDIAKSAFDNVLAFIDEMKLNPEDKYASVGYVTDKVAEITSQILNE